MQFLLGSNRRSVTFYRTTGSGFVFTQRRRLQKHYRSAAVLHPEREDTARDQQARGIVRRVRRFCDLHSLTWSSTARCIWTPRGTYSTRFTCHVPLNYRCMKVWCTSQPHLDRRFAKSRAPFSESDEVFNEGLPWKQVCKDVNAMPHYLLTTTSGNTGISFLSLAVLTVGDGTKEFPSWHYF